MRIAVVNNFFPPRTGGSAHLSDSLAQGYAAAGHEVLVLTAAYQDAPESEVRAGCRVVRIPSWTLPKALAFKFDIGFTVKPGQQRRVNQILDEFKPDVIHQHGQFFDLTWASGRWARKHDVPVLLSVHTRLESPGGLNNAIFRTADAVLVAPLLRLFKPRFVVMDVLMESYIKDRYASAIGGLEYIPVGVDPDWLLGGDGAKIRARHELGDRPVVLSIGHVIPLRDRVRLVRALPRILERHPDVAVLVVGGVYTDEFLTLADSLGVRHAIVTAGTVPKAEIPDYLAAADLECHELDGFGFGTASLEAMAAGCPVVAAVRADNFPGIELRDGEQLFLTPVGDVDALADAISHVLDDPTQARSVAGVGGQKLVHEKFTMRSVLDQHLELLTRMAQKK